MKIERIKKNHKKEIVIGGLILVSIISAITLVTTRAKYKITQDIKLAKGTVNYTPYDFHIAYINVGGNINTCSTTNCNEMSNYIPNSSSYALTSSSYCETKNASGTYVKDNSIILTHQNNTIITNLKQKKAKCYLYFADTTKPTISNVTASVTQNSISVTVTAGDNVGVTEYYYQIGSNAVVKQTTNTYTFTGLTAGTAYSIKVYVKDATGNQSDTTNKSVATKTLAEETLNKLNITDVKTTTPDFSKAATTNEGVYAVSDGMYGGTSYYFRGAVTNNYIMFANYCWRIIRINGDGTIRLIYDGTACHANGEKTTDSIAVASQAYNASSNRSEYVGWTYSVGSQRTLGGTNSNAKTQTETWYNNNIGNNVTYSNKIAAGKFCNDRNMASGYTWTSIYSSGTRQLKYAARERLENFNPTLSCNEGDTYTLKVGAITSDEATFAGGLLWRNNPLVNNAVYFLYNGNDYWTMSPGQTNFGPSNVGNYISSAGNKGIDCDCLLCSNGHYTGTGIRPVINLHSDVIFSSGDGTQSNPYVVS